MKDHKHKRIRGPHVRAQPTPNRRVNVRQTITDNAFVKRFHALYDAGNYDAVTDVIVEALKNEPDNHVLMLLLGLVYLGKGKLKRSLGYQMQAIGTHPCPHTIWYLAYYMKLAGQVDWAIALWKSVIDMSGHEDDPSESVPCNACCEVLDDRSSLIANARFMVSVSYLQTGRPRLSQRYKRDYERDLASGVKGMFPAEAIDTLREVTRLEYKSETT